jgi:hypothetical protein
MTDFEILLLVVICFLVVWLYRLTKLATSTAQMTKLLLEYNEEHYKTLAKTFKVVDAQFDALRNKPAGPDNVVFKQGGSVEKPVSGV